LTKIWKKKYFNLIYIIIVIINIIVLLF